MYKLTAVILAMALGAPTALAQKAPLAGEERTDFIATTRAADPAIPDDVLDLYADAGGDVSWFPPCEVADWIASDASTAPQFKKDVARLSRQACTLKTPDVTEQEAVTRLGDQSLAMEREGDALTVLMKSEATGCRVTGALQIPLEQIGESAFWARSVRLENLDEGFVSIVPSPPCGEISFESMVTYRGPDAPAPPPMAENIRGVVVERGIDSVATGEARRLRVYLPPGYTREQSWPTLYAMDGSLSQNVIDEMIALGEIRPIVVVGIGSGPDSVIGEPNGPRRQQLRYLEYTPLENPEYRALFDRHMRFVADEVTAWAADQYGASRRREDRMITGVSQGGSFALWAGLLRPDVFGAAAPLSPGGGGLGLEDIEKGKQKARFFLGGGQYEPVIFLKTKGVETYLRNEGYEVEASYPYAGHFQDQWELRLREALREIFPPQPDAG